jgi:hypothetical protein
MALFVYTGSAYATGGIFGQFSAQYPGSNSANNASCQLCHGSDTQDLNEYGYDLQLSGVNFIAVQNDLSVNINGGTTYLDEINASTQPGWTTGANNTLTGVTVLRQVIKHRQAVLEPWIRCRRLKTVPTVWTMTAI